MVVRHSAGAVTAVIGLLLLPSLLGPLFGDARAWDRGHLAHGGPGEAHPDLRRDRGDVGSLGPWPSLLLVAGYTAALLLIAAGTFRGRDA
ncbi:hypothetical protein [Streptomyces hirsutus]|uniref:hypothetical protein n=1 Tax=Streptomyces hirsutus TaxID=35620 RepID=UPI00369A4A03